eukprot:m.281219 g.281219  ORF g.281219 m.281219 type:complete len:88 (-) comp16330_c2_seq9:132-395(-)
MSLVHTMDSLFYMLLKKNNKAEHHFLEALRISPTYIEGLFNYGTFLASDSNRLLESKRQFERVLELNPSHSGAQQNMKYVEYNLERQ